MACASLVDVWGEDELSGRENGRRSLYPPVGEGGECGEEGDGKGECLLSGSGGGIEMERLSFLRLFGGEA